MSKVAGTRVPANPNPPQARIPGAPEVATNQDKVGPTDLISEAFGTVVRVAGNDCRAEESCDLLLDIRTRSYQILSCSMNYFRDVSALHEVLGNDDPIHHEWNRTRGREDHHRPMHIFIRDR